MRSKLLRTALAHLFLAAALTANPLEIAGATDRSDPRRLELQRDLRSVRSRVERAPRASSFELKDLQRRLHGLRIEAPRDPRLQELEIELRRLRAQADRNVDRAGAAVLSRAPRRSRRTSRSRNQGISVARTRPRLRHPPDRTSASGWLRCRGPWLRASVGSSWATPQRRPGCSRRPGATSPSCERFSMTRSPRIRT